MNPNWVSIPNDTSNSIRVYMGDWVKDLKITANENPIPDCNSFQIHVPTRQQSYFSGDFSTYTPRNVDKTSHFANNLYLGHNERRFHSKFQSRVKFRSKFTWYRIDISFRIELFNPEWKMEWTQSGISCNSIRIHVNKYNSTPMISTETEWVRSGLKLNPDSCEHPLGVQTRSTTTNFHKILLSTKTTQRVVLKAIKGILVIVFIILQIHTQK